MKILAIGDFHGKFPKKISDKIKDVDLVICVGDYPKWSLREEFFENYYNNNFAFDVDEERFEKEFEKDWETADSIFQKLNSCGKPVFLTVGNYDSHGVNDSHGYRKDERDDLFSRTIAKYHKIKRIDYRSVNFKGVSIIGSYGGTFPGYPKSKNFKKHYKILQKLFKKSSAQNREGKLIFIAHNMPYDCRLDKIRDKRAPSEVYGEHYGSKLIRRIINKYQPALFIGGHFHENQGKTKIGKTVVIDVGEAGKGKHVLIDFDEEKGKIKSIKFFK